MSLDDDLRTARSLLDEAGMVAFAFPGEGQIVGAGLQALGGLLRLFESSSAHPGLTLADVVHDIESLQAELTATQTAQLENFTLDTELRNARERLQTFSDLYSAALDDPDTALKDLNGEKTDLVKLATAIPPASPSTSMQNVVSVLESLTTPAARVQAYLLYADCRTKLQTLHRQCLVVEMEAARRNSAPTPWTTWFRPPGPSLHVTALREGLRAGIAYLEDAAQTGGGLTSLDQLRTHYDARYARAEAYGHKHAVWGQGFLEQWRKDGKAQLLDQISSAGIDALRGTVETMGVVDLWKETLQTLFDDEYDSTAPFRRGDKFNPARRLPTIWLDEAVTERARTIAVQGNGDMLTLLEQQTELSIGARPLVGPIRAIPWKVASDQRVLHLVVVNALPVPLLIEEIIVPHGGLLTTPTVAAYPTDESGAPTHVKGWTMQPNEESNEPTVWIDSTADHRAAAEAAGDAVPHSSVGVWQVMGRPSSDSAEICVKFKSLDHAKVRAGLGFLFVQGSYPAPGAAGAPNVSASIHGDAESAAAWLAARKPGQRCSSGGTSDEAGVFSASVVTGQGSHPGDVTVTLFVGPPQT